MGTGMDVDADVPDMPDTGTTVEQTDASIAPEGCDRDTLRALADSYFQALGTGDTSALTLHPNARYTENGRPVVLGLGLWLERPETQFVRHVLDESQCSTLSEGVVGPVLSRFVVGVRLRHEAGQLMDIEAQIVTPNINYYNPDGVVVTGIDSWIQPVPASERMDRDALVRLAEQYFDSTQDRSLIPAHDPACKRRQNGTLTDFNGSCASPGTAPYEQRRFPATDELAGIVTGVVRYENFIGMYLFKAQGNVVQNIEVIGGAAAATTGW